MRTIFKTVPFFLSPNIDSGELLEITTFRDLILIATSEGIYIHDKRTRETFKLEPEF